MHYLMWITRRNLMYFSKKILCIFLPRKRLGIIKEEPHLSKDTIKNNTVEILVPNKQVQDYR